MSRLYTLEDECLDYAQDYESVIVVKDIEKQKKNKGTNYNDLQQQLSLQFYSRQQIQSPKLNSIQRLITEQKENFRKQETKQINFKIKSPSKCSIAITPKITAKTPQYSKTIKPLITITPLNFKDSFKKIQLLVSKQQKSQLDFSKFKRSIY